MGNDGLTLVPGECSDLHVEDDTAAQCSHAQPLTQATDCFVRIP